MSFTPCFGSFGDFVAAAQFLCQARQALRSVGGSSTQYQKLVSDIYRFEVLLREVSNLELSVDVPPDLDAHLKHCASLTAGTAKEFHLRIEAYRARLFKDSCTRGIRQHLRGAWWKLKWSFLMAGDVKEFRDQMSDQMSEIGSVLSLINVTITQAGECRQIELSSRVLELHRNYFGGMMGSSSEPLARNLQRFHVEEFPISLIDAMGVKHSPPFRMFTAYDHLIGYIKDQFRHNPGRALIDRGKFALTNEEGNTVWKSVYAKSIRPGSKLDMSVVTRRSILDGENLCPKCKFHTPPHSRICAFCGASISELDNEQWKADTAVDEAIDGNDSDNMTSNEATTSQNESHETPEKPERMDETMLPEGEMIKCFKRIMVIKKRSHSGEGNWESCLNLPVHKLLEEICNNSGFDVRTISNTLRHKEGDRLKHEFLLDHCISEGQCLRSS